MQWLKDKFNWILGSISLFLAVILFLKKDNTPSKKYLEEENKILTNKTEIGIIESDIKKTEEVKEDIKLQHEAEVKKVLDDKDPKNVIDFFNNRLNK
jgi:hypothetical protein